MNSDIDYLFLIINSLVTMLCGMIVLYSISKRRIGRHFFYYGWSFGFVLYGFQILSRALSFSDALAFSFMFFAFLLFMISTSSLSPRRDVVISFSSVFFPCIILSIYYYVGILHKYPWSDTYLWILASFIFYLPMTILMVIHRRLFGDCVDKLIVGWFLLFMVNVLSPGGGWISDVFAIIFKVIILAGVMSYDFCIVTKKVQGELSSRAPSFAGCCLEEGGLSLVRFGTREEPPLMAVSKWIKNEIERNIKENIETSIIVLHDVIPYGTLRSAFWDKPELVHVFIFSENPGNCKEFTAIRYGMTELGATITEICRKQRESKSRGMIILVDLSILIHTFGALQAYGFLLNKMGSLRSSGITLTAVFHPQTHEEQVVALFKTVADRIIQN